MSKGSYRRLALLAVMGAGALAAFSLAPACSSTPPRGVVTLASAQIGPEGGYVETAEGIRVDVPPGALTKAVTVSIGDAPNAPVDVGATRVGRAVVISPSALVFAKPVWVTLVVDPSLLGPGQSASDVTVAMYPDISKLEVIEARARDATHVVAATMHFSFYAPQITTACPPGGADITYDACEIGCKQGYHWAGRGIPIQGLPPIFCPEGWDAFASRCEVDTSPSYQTCNQLGCGAGFHVATSLLGPAPPFCAPTANAFSCEVSRGPAYDACEGACDYGYTRTGAATNASACVWQSAFGPVDWSSHCVADPKTPDVCSGDAGKDATADATTDAGADAASDAATDAATDAGDASQDAGGGG